MRQTNKTSKFWSCDFETTTPESDYFKRTGDVCICLAGGMRSSDKFFVFDTSFLKLLDQIIAADNDKVITLYFHNLGNFDGSYILAELEENGYQFNPELPNYLDTFIADNASVYSIKFEYKNRRFQVFDSLKLLTLSIADLGKAQGLPKLESDYRYEPLPLEQFSREEIEYLKRDCEIPIQPLLSIFKTFKRPKMTAGSTSVQGLADHIYEKEGDKKLIDWFTKCELDVALKMLPFCFGGLTFYNRQKRYAEVHGVYCYDANSFYPTQMATEPMIVGSSFREVDENYKLANNETELVIIVCYKAELKGEKDFFFLRNFAAQNKRMFAESTWGASKYVDKIDQPTTMFFFRCELEELENWYAMEYVVVQRYVYQTSGYMETYIRWLYDERKRLKAEKNPSELTFKIILNSTFGKFMENPVKEQMLYLPRGQFKLGDEAYGFQLIRKKDEEFDLKNSEAFVGIALQTKNVVRNPVIGAYVTALARTKLMRLVRKYRPYILYGDTDSVFVTKKLDELENKPNELGFWKNEYPEFPEGFTMYVFGRKRYCCFNKEEEQLIKTGLCGASKTKINKLLQEGKYFSKERLDSLLNQQIKGVKLQKKMVHGKRYLIEGLYQIKDKNE